MAMTVEQRDAMICDLYKRGVKVNEIIKLTEVSQNTIYNVLHKSGVRLRTLENADKLKKQIDIICAMFDRNTSVKEICGATNLKREVVVGILKQFRQEEYKAYLRKIAVMRKAKDTRENSMAIKRALTGKKVNPYNMLESDGSIKGEKLNEEKISTNEVQESLAEKLKKELADIDAAIRNEQIEEEPVKQVVIEVKETEEERFEREKNIYANAVIVDTELARGKTLTQIVEEYGFKPGDYIVDKDENRDRPKLFRDAQPMVFQGK